MLQLKPALRTGACVAVVGLGVWGLWYRLVLRRVARTPRPWGPQWLAVRLSGLLHDFGCWYLQWSNNGEETIKAGVWEQGKQYIIVWHPHGAFTVSALYFISHWVSISWPWGVDRHGLRGRVYCAVAPLLLQIPGLSEFLLLCNARSVESKSFDALLASGATVAVQPGGLLEQVETDDQRERIFFPARLGFIRMALKHGTKLLPCYCFGENQLYRTASWTRRLNRWLLDNFGIGNLVILGQGGLPNSPVFPNPLMLPVFRRRLALRLGDPVDLGPRNENPTDEQVEEAFQKYIAALRKMFDAYKDECLPPDVAARGLEVVWPGHKKANGKTNGQIGSKKAD
mmetsp:Transcript_7371/g.20623  ORF Transcript_7371/g.20623 Transcript_7371/m.20623 type:complete len:341 (-) Transcript_7371:122-1144(-)